MSYHNIAPFYDLLSAGYSAGGIRRAKLVHLKQIQPGQKVLYVGAGSGEECVKAAQKGATVTVVELSSAMLDRCRKRFEQCGQSAHFVLADARESLEGSGNYDFVVAPFFLNVFARTEVAATLLSLSKHLKSGGQLISVDFRAPSGGAFAFLQKLFYLPPLVLFYLIANNPWHELYDYPAIAQKQAPRLRLLGRSVQNAWGLPLFENVVWEKEH